jgi:hypothetical protein
MEILIWRREYIYPSKHSEHQLQTLDIVHFHVYLTTPRAATHEN